MGQGGVADEGVRGCVRAGSSFELLVHFWVQVNNKYHRLGAVPEPQKTGPPRVSYYRHLPFPLKGCSLLSRNSNKPFPIWAHIHLSQN